MNEIDKNEIAIVVLSFDGFYELWSPFFDYFFKAWPNCPYKVYLLNNEKEFIHEKVENLMVGKDQGWSDSLIKGLKKIKTERVFLLYEDAFIFQLDYIKVESIFVNSVQNDFLSVQLRPSLFVSSMGMNRIVKIPKNALYRNALFANLIKRDHLLKLLNPIENAWEFEIIGNDRSKEFDYYSVKRPLIHYHHGIVKGKWIPHTYKIINQSFGNFEKLNSIMSRKDYFIFSLKERILSFYYKILPINLLIIVEKKRANNSLKNR